MVRYTFVADGKPALRLVRPKQENAMKRIISSLAALGLAACTTPVSASRRMRNS
jgi:hypothetical protein